MASSTDHFAELLKSWGELVDQSLDQYIGDRLLGPDRLREAMRYSLFAGGKRLRPILVLMATDASGGTVESALPAAAAVEMLHTYSLIHDDLPAMDDDEYRRGQLTCHRRFDEATAILAGDALHTLAFEILTEIQPTAVAARCVKELAGAAGPTGMVGGQVDDLFPPPGGGDLDWLESLHSRKTGALLTACLRMGAAIGGASAEQFEALSRYGRSIGLAFQIADDLLDVEGDPARVGKGVNKDDAAGKTTYPKLLGVEASRERARRLIADALEQLRPFGSAADHLRSLANYVVERDR